MQSEQWFECCQEAARVVCESALKIESVSVGCLLSCDVCALEWTRVLSADRMSMFFSPLEVTHMMIACTETLKWNQNQDLQPAGS